MIRKNGHRISLVLDKEDFDLFQRHFPHCLSKVIKNTVKACLKDKDYFELIFFEKYTDLKTTDYVFNRISKKLDGVLK